VGSSKEAEEICDHGISSSQGDEEVRSASQGSKECNSGHQARSYNNGLGL
jgi:hypothetical protein